MHTPESQFSQATTQTILDRYASGEYIEPIARDLGFPVDAVQRVFTQLRFAEPAKYKRLEDKHHRAIAIALRSR